MFKDDSEVATLVISCIASLESYLGKQARKEEN